MNTTIENEIIIADESAARSALQQLIEPHFHSKHGNCISRKCVNADTTASTLYRFCYKHGGLGIKLFINLAREFGYDVVLRKREADNDR
ncbi:MAG: hypothetical protein IJO91_05620 [Oscillospiraceae bacterium]|nr:hypothetical protein [Oscillospiraceae bacterium]